MKCQQQLPAVTSLEVLVVDADPATSDLVKQAAAEWSGRVRIAASIDQANAEMKSRPADVLLVNLQINDNAGLTLIKSLRQKYPRTHAIALSRGRKSDTCLEAWRAGAADMLIAPFQPDDPQRSLTGILGKRLRTSISSPRRNVRLRQVCKRLNKARHEISQQVDLLCNDLVRAYQEMAQQLNITQITVEFAQAIGDEIEVEGLLRRTMEWVLAKIGPINAAVYLSDANRRFCPRAPTSTWIMIPTPSSSIAVGETIIKAIRRGKRPRHLRR